MSGIHPLHPRSIVSQNGGVLYDFGRGSEAFSAAVKAFWVKGGGIWAARLLVGDQLLGVSKADPDDSRRQRLRFSANDAVLPLHILHSHVTLVFLTPVKADLGPVEVWWEEGACWCRDPLRPEVYVASNMQSGLSHNRWYFVCGMAGPKFAEGFESRALLDEAERSLIKHPM